MVVSRVLYIGSSPLLTTATSDLEAIQGPLKELYPVDDEYNLEGMDVNISISNSCIQMQFVNNPNAIVHFPISSLTQCAAVRCISTTNSATGEKGAKFVALDDSLAGKENSFRLAIFTAITRQEKGRNVLECHGFICATDTDATDLLKYASIADQNYKQGETMVPSMVISAEKDIVQANADRDPFLNVDDDPANRISADSSVPVTSTLTKSPTLQNGGDNTNDNRMGILSNMLSFWKTCCCRR